MAKKLERFYYTQDGATEGPFLCRQIQSLIRQGLIRADATIKSEEGTAGDIDSFIQAYGWREESDDLGVAAKQLYWLRIIGVIVIVAWLLYLIFGFRLYR
jgi:hypothetical protein